MAYRRIAVLGACMALSLAARTAPATASKRLIEFGWDQPDQAFLVAHLAEIEAAPFEGCVFGVTYRRPDGRRGSFEWDAWGRFSFTDSMLAGVMDTLRALHIPGTRSDFLRMNVTPGQLDWYDDYGPVLHNATLAARMAKLARARGVFLDTEQYAGEIFDYVRAALRPYYSYAEYAAQARARGREVMRAFERGYPGLTVFLSYGWSTPYIRSGRDCTNPARERYNLLIPFLNGMLEAASDSARIVDGDEGAYFLKDPIDVDHYYHLTREALHRYGPDSLKSDRQVLVGYGIWLDHDSQVRGWDLADFTKNYRTPDMTRVVLRRALERCDLYVWLYSEQPRWWSAPGGRVRLPDAYVRAVLDARAGIAGQ